MEEVEESGRRRHSELPVGHIAGLPGAAGRAGGDHGEVDITGAPFSFEERSCCLKNKILSCAEVS